MDTPAGADHLSADRLTHAGGVVYRAAAARHEMLLVRGRMPPHGWVLPKGHIEAGETPEACARREIREEAGIDSEPELLLGVDEFTRDGKRVTTAFYLMRFLRPAPALEEREQCWTTFGEALALVSFEGARRIIRQAAEHVTLRSQAGGAGRKGEAGRAHRSQEVRKDNE
jgi:ADP-ribose pyrophosphatase YjhB (NUDIX family)